MNSEQAKKPAEDVPQEAIAKREKGENRANRDACRAVEEDVKTWVAKVDA